MKYKNKLTAFVWLCLLFTMVCCTDWDAHYDAESQRVWSDKTLWEEIASRPQLGEFAELLEQYGYKEILNGSQMYTVFAPMGVIDTEGLSTEKIRKEVIENHIARFAHSANSANNTTNTLKGGGVVMLNSKSVLFTRNGDSYTFGNNKLTDEHNIIAKNGVLHVIEGQQTFFHNIWEYLTTDSRFDSICNYLYSFNEEYLDEEASVKGEINAEGKQEYLDSVIISYNSLLYSLGQLNNEDSTYTMIIPTNDAWKDAYERIEPYFKYPAKNVKNADSLQMYYTKLSVVRDLVFSHTVQGSMSDSLISTARGVFHKPFETLLSDFSGWDQAVKCSNGQVFVVDELKHEPWESWHEIIKVEAERQDVLAEDLDCGTSKETNEKLRLVYRRKLASSDSLFTKVSGGAYLEVLETKQDQHPYVAFNVRNTLRGKYELKVVFLPQNLASKTILPNIFDAKCYVANDNGVRLSAVTSKRLVNDPTRIDTVDIGTLNFASCFYAQEGAGLQLELKSTPEQHVVDGRLEYEPYSGTFLIDCIILEPVKE